MQETHRKRERERERERESERERERERNQVVGKTALPVSRHIEEEK
jgi:hypothetical protein